MPLLLRIAGILIALIVVSALARPLMRHVVPLFGGSGVPVPVTTPAEAQATIDNARKDIEAAAKQAADRASEADR